MRTALAMLAAALAIPAGFAAIWALIIVAAQLTPKTDRAQLRATLQAQIDDLDSGEEE